MAERFRRNRFTVVVTIFTHGAILELGDDVFVPRDGTDLEAFFCCMQEIDWVKSVQNVWNSCFCYNTKKWRGTGASSEL